MQFQKTCGCRFFCINGRSQVEGYCFWCNFDKYQKETCVTCLVLCTCEFSTPIFTLGIKKNPTPISDCEFSTPLVSFLQNLFSYFYTQLQTKLLEIPATHGWTYLSPIGQDPTPPRSNVNGCLLTLLKIQLRISFLKRMGPGMIFFINLF